MTLTAISLLESARRKFFMNRRTSCLESRNQTFLGSGDRSPIGRKNRRYVANRSPIGDRSPTANRSQESARRKFFMNRRTSRVESRNQTFLGSGARNDSNSQQLARIGEKKIFHEHEVHQVQKVGIKRFWAQETEMSLTAISLLRSARRKFFMNTTYIMSRKQDQTFLGSGARNDCKIHQLAGIGEKKIFHELDVHHVQKVGIKRFWAQET